MGLHSIGRERPRISDKLKLDILAWYAYQRSAGHINAKLWMTPSGRFSYKTGTYGWGQYAEKISLASLHWYGLYYSTGLKISNFKMSMIEKPK